MKHKTTWAVVGVMVALALIVAINALITWAVTKFIILPIAAALGYDLPFWPVFILTWVAASLVTSLTRKKKS